MLDRTAIITKAIDNAQGSLPGDIDSTDQERLTQELLDMREDFDDESFRSEWLDSLPDDLHCRLEEILIPDMQEEEHTFEDEEGKETIVRVTWRPANATHVNGHGNRHWIWEDEPPVTIDIEDGEVTITEANLVQVTGKTQDVFEAHRVDSPDEVTYGSAYCIEIEHA